MNQHPRTLVVIVNYKVGDLVVNCLRSLQAQVAGPEGQMADVTVVNNPSGDDSVAIIQKAIDEHGWGAWARVIESPVNGGFAYGNNQGFRDAKARGRDYDYYWLLNPDTEARPNALQELTSFMDAHPKAGMAGSSVEEDADGTRWPFAFRFHSILGEFEQAMQFGLLTKLLGRFATAQRMGDHPQMVQWLSGCSFIVRGRVLDDVGLMDEQFFLYYEETDWARRAHAKGWEHWYVPASRIYHIAGRSTGVSGEGSQLRRTPDYVFESRRRYFMKHHGRAYAMVADAAWLIGASIARLRRRLQGQSDGLPPHYMKDFWRNSAIVNGRMPGNDRIAALPAAVTSR